MDFRRRRAGRVAGLRFFKRRPPENGAHCLAVPELRDLWIGLSLGRGTWFGQLSRRHRRAIWNLNGRGRRHYYSGVVVFTGGQFAFAGVVWVATNHGKKGRLLENSMLFLRK